MQVTEFSVPGSPLNMASLKTALDDMFGAVVSTNMETTSPDNPEEGMLWWDTSGSPANILKTYSTLGWTPIVSVNTTSGVINFYRSHAGTALATAFALTLLSAATASDALTTLGVSTFAKTLLDDTTSAAARETLEISGGTPDDSSVTLAKLSNYAAGNELLIADDAEVTSIVAGYTKLKEIYVPRNGTLRIKFDLKRVAGGGVSTTYGRIYQNDVALGTEQSTTSEAYATKSEDIAGITAGSLIQLYGKAYSTAVPVGVRNFRLYALAGSKITEEIQTV